MRFNNYCLNEQTNKDVSTLIDIMCFMEGYKNNSVNEEIVSNIKDGLSNVMKKSGIHVKQSKGLIHILLSAEKGLEILVYHAFMVFYKYDDKQVEYHQEQAVKQLKKINKEDILDFLLKLDTLTLHIVSGPLHMIDALTGTHIWANVKQKAESIKKRATDAISSLESLKDKLEGKLKGQVQKYSNALRRVFDIGGHKKISEEIVGSDISTPDVKIGDKIDTDICPITGKKKKKKKNKKLRSILKNL